MRLALTFDDVSLIPQYSALDSRTEIDIGTELFSDDPMSIPILSAPMDTVTELKMQQTMFELGGSGVHHRYVDNDKILLRAALRGYGPIAVSPSMGIEFINKLMDIIKSPQVVIDVAHGDSKPALDYAYEWAKRGARVISGNIVTAGAADRYVDCGVTVFRVGIGSGSSCTTRILAGVGVPQWTAIREIDDHWGATAKIISDGGCKTSGDIVKALAAGADAVMLGWLLAGTDEAPGDIMYTQYYEDNVEKLYHMTKPFRGMASTEALKEARKDINPEGESGYVKYRGTIEGVIADLVNGIKRGFAYLGASNLHELQANAVFIRVTENGRIEGQARI